jgi:large repetitive protein
VASAGRTLDLSSVDLDPTTPGQQTTLTVSGEGVWTVDSSGEVIFTPESGYFLDPTPITYTIADDQGNLSNVATITVDYVPVASDDVSTGNPIGQPVIIDVLANDIGGDTPVPGTVQIVGTDNPGEELVVPNEGTWTVTPTTGAITFTPETGFTGDPTPIEYTVQDARATRPTRPRSW